MEQQTLQMKLSETGKYGLENVESFIYIEVMINQGDMGNGGIFQTFSHFSCLYQWVNRFDM